MPQKEPLSPPLLAVAGTLAAVPAAWLVLAADALVAGIVGWMAGFAWTGLTLAPSFVVRAELVTGGPHGAGAWTAILLAGPLVSALLAWGVLLLVESVRSAAWLRVMALEAVGFAWLRIPALVLGGTARGGRGPVAELYTQLGEPQAGRWPVGLLALLVLAFAAALVGRRSVAVGRTWMRADGPQFRRRLARILGGYPALVALAGWSVLAPWASPAWMVVWLLLTLSAIHVLMS